MASFKGKSTYYATFVAHAAEIARKIFAEFGNVDEVSVRRVMLNMALPEDNPNYIRTMQYMPDTFNKALYDNGGGNSYDSEWMSHTDAKMTTVIRAGIARSKERP